VPPAPVPQLALAVHSRATPRIGTPVLHAMNTVTAHLPPMRDELATFRETHLHHLREVIKFVWVCFV
jgi:hypothetical protein